MTENPFEDDTDIDSSETEVELDDNKSFADLRKAYKRSERQLKATEKELAELRDFKQVIVQQQRESQLASVFAEVGLNTKHAALFEKVNPEAEVTPEAVQAFAAEYDLVTNAGETVEAPETPSSGFTPVTTGAPGAVTMLDQEDIRKLVKANDWDAIKKAYDQGRVEQVSVPWNR